MHKRVKAEAENIGNTAVASGRQYPSLESVHESFRAARDYPQPVRAGHFMDGSAWRGNRFVENMHCSVSILRPIATCTWRRGVGVCPVGTAGMVPRARYVLGGLR
jgi:hypothetical protein